MTFAKEISTEALAGLFDPEYAKKLNCSLAEHVLRQLAIELLNRGQYPVITEAIREMALNAFIGPEVCEHGRSNSGFCEKCDA